MVVCVSVGLRVVGVVGGVAIGLIAVALAQMIPPRMERAARERSPVFWLSAVVAAGVFGWQSATAAAGWSLLPAYLAFGATTLAVTLTDIDHQLIPNRILFPGLGIAGALLVIGAAFDDGLDDLPRAIGAAVAYFLFLLVVALLARGGFGMGDVKLALLLGLFLGYVGWDALGVGLTLAVLLGGVASVVLLVFTDRSRRAKFAYGPFLVAGAWIGLFWGPQIADWYLG